MTAKLKLSTLEGWLWDSATILRGSIDSADFKNYIFGLLFLKRFNDVFEEAITRIIEKDHITRAAAEKKTYFKMPPESRWEDIKVKTENIGNALDIAFAAIERENATLEGVMTATKFNDKEKLSDEILKRLLQHFSKHSLKNQDLYTPDLLGDAYEYLLKQFADDAGKKGGEFYTPKGVAITIVRLIKPQPGNTVYDPTCGSGGMLIESAKYVAALLKGKTDNHINISLYGQEKNLGTWAIAKMNMILHNFMDADLRKGDTLTDPLHKNKKNELRQYDRVIANPPFSQSGWWTPAETTHEVKLDKNGKEKKITPNYTKAVVDKYNRFVFGIPPRGYADLAFVQHMLAVLAKDGKAGVVLPHGALFRSGTEGAIREKLLKADVIEAIIGLPAALFYNTTIPASIWIIGKSRPAHLKNKVIIIDASNEYKEGKNQNELLDTHINKIVNTYDHFVLGNNMKVNDKFARTVDIAEIAQNEYSLNISRYINSSEIEVAINLHEVKAAISELEAKEKVIDQTLANYLKELGI
ncbi:type I restriction enzyme M protein [Chitinophaga niastensis]|uniref:site-specific DNA-methyltransferase (adenine-specific) n=1 Tax=Chitinophaga niastensis TaxID=536980 RepID=A0A2P8HTH2_CHINA|nr:class I SAM-dependent DNA methyltransferase [Chitinophaga niastensis]PSL49485.1 type I restriction enzyme M protein [Chitinophaga niastensis]